MVIFFQLISIIIGAFAVYHSSTKTYLTAKNDMIERDLNSVKDQITSWVGMSWYFDYWKAHPHEVAEEMTDEDYELSAANFYDGRSEEEACEFFSSLPERTQLALAKDMYRICSFEIDYEKEHNNYGGLYCFDIREGDRGFVYFECNYKEREGDKLGTKWEFDLKDHPAAQELLEDPEKEIAFEQIDVPEFSKKKLYIGYIPLIYNGELKAVLCLDYNWDAFDKDLTRHIWVNVGLGVAGMVLVCALLMLIIERQATKPVQKLQRAVQDYTKTRDSEKAAEQLKEITVNNEVGALAENFGALTSDITNYINDIQNAKLKIQEISSELLESLAQTIDAKDKYTNGHSSRVAIYSRMLAKNLGLSENDQDMLYNMGLLHDIGKIGIPDTIINKTSKLTDEEFNMIQSHPIFGWEILKNVHSQPELALAARWHHENYNGTGYPDKKKGEEIPFEVRIVAVADSYDAMTSNRSYRKYLPQDVVRDEIEKNAGTQFDPRVAKAMLEIIDSDTNYMLHE